MPIHQVANSDGNYHYNMYTYDNCRWEYHFHSNYELIHILDGSCLVEVDGRAENLCAGNFALILPNQLHALHAAANSRVFIAVFSEEFVFRFAAHTRSLVGEQAKFSCEAPIADFLRHYLIETPTTDIYLLKSCFYAACQQYRCQVELCRRDADTDDLFRRVTDYVAEHFRDPLTLQQTAHALGFEYHYMSRRFHEIFNMNFCHFVNQYRINYANDLLQKKNSTIAEVAFESGFQSVRSFNAVYKELVGYTPRQHKLI